MAKSSLPSLPLLSPTPSSSSSSAPTSPKESLPLQKKYAMVQEISKQKREKYGKMFIPTEFYATLRKKDEIPQQQQETIKLTKDNIKSTKKKNLSSKFLIQKLKYRRPSFEMVEKVHQQHPKIYKPTVLNETMLSDVKDSSIESACSNLEKCTCEYTSENHQNPLINKDSYADKTKGSVDSEYGSQFVVEKLNPFNYKIQKIDEIQNKNKTTEEKLSEISTLSMGLQEQSKEKPSRIKPVTSTPKTRTQPELVDSTIRPNFYSTRPGFYSKRDQVYHIQPNIKLSRQSISHPPIRAASFHHHHHHHHQPRKFHPIVLEPPYHPFEPTEPIYDPRFRQEPEYYPYVPYSGPIYKGQFPNMYPQLPYRHIFPSLQREPVFYHNPSMWIADMEQQQHQQCPSMDYYGYYGHFPYRSPPNHDIREMPPIFYPRNN